MQTVTQISEHPRKPGRYVVDVDGKEFAVIGAEALSETKMRVGVIVDDTLAARLNDATADVAMYDRALNLLAFRARSARELHRRLVERGQSAVRAEKVIARLREVGLIDDADFARQVARSKVSAGASRRRLHQELFRRGIAREVADEAVAQVLDEEGFSEAESIERVARKKWRTLERLDGPTRRRRLQGFLARRGYDSDDVWRVVRQLDGESSEAGDVGPNDDA